jgi:hypothetical protein
MSYGHTHDLTGFHPEIIAVNGQHVSHDHAGGDNPHDHGWGKAYNRDGALVGDASASGAVDPVAFPPAPAAVQTPEQRRIAELEAQVAAILGNVPGAPPVPGPVVGAVPPSL